MFNVGYNCIFNLVPPTDWIKKHVIIRMNCSNEKLNCLIIYIFYFTLFLLKILDITISLLRYMKYLLSAFKACRAKLHNSYLYCFFMTLCLAYFHIYSFFRFSLTWFIQKFLFYVNGPKTKGFRRKTLKYSCWTF